MWGWLSQNHHGFFQPAKSLDLAQVQASAGAIWDHQWDRLGAQVEEHRHSCSRALAHGIYGTSADRSAVRSDWGHGPKALHHHRWSCHRNAGSHRGQITHWPSTDGGYHLPIIGWSNNWLEQPCRNEGKACGIHCRLSTRAYLNMVATVATLCGVK